MAQFYNQKIRTISFLPRHRVSNAKMTPGHRKKRFPGFCFCICFSTSMVFLYSEDLSSLFSPSILMSYRRQTADSNSQRPKSDPQSRKPREDGSYSEAQLRQRFNLQTNVPFSIGKATDGCDIFTGKWVRDNVSHPIYQEHECPYIQPQLTCREHGRPDSDYQHWRWQPHHCSLPKFNATLMLETLRGKRMMYVGDSLNRGQYVSMICLLHSVIPEHAKSIETRGSLTIFRAKDYSATIEFYWAPFLLESNSDDATIHRVSDRVVRANSIQKHARHWKGADIVVFNTYLWWMTGLDMKILRSGSFGNGTEDIIELKTEDAYRMALEAMVKWVEKHMDPLKTRAFFTSMSPTHDKSKEWGAEKEGNCYNETVLISEQNYWGSSSSKSMMRVTGDVFSKMSVPITFLNITQLSLYRKDAHTTIYKKQWSPLTPEQLANPVSYADCVHWCLPGLQDTWNELLYTKLLYT